ncbi:50S ribosomal protein L29 [Candidatus Pacearchaeota archaeon]|nr:50S ribosomal protein L29 [Candidatus Pacearchaeota archaeon]|tara:strand:- start:4205 stop:4381 length:177 start_codon:yes stop_codon:yes gene_type:complete
MAKFKELKNLGKKEIESKIKELQLDLIKAKVTASKGGKVKIRELRKTLARLNALKNKS